MSQPLDNDVLKAYPGGGSLQANNVCEFSYWEKDKG